MTIRGWKRLGTALVVVALAAAGIRLWLDHRETLAKAVLAAEIRAEMAARARPAPPAPTEEEAYTANLYRAAMAKIDADAYFARYGSEDDQRPWSRVPQGIADSLVANAAALKLLDEATAREACQFDKATSPALGRRGWCSSLLLDRGYAALCGGSADAAAEDVRRVVRLANTLLAAPLPDSDGSGALWPGIFLFSVEDHAAALLTAIATDPGETPAAIPALVAAAREPWGTPRANREGVGALEDQADSVAVRLLRPDARAYLDGILDKSEETQALLSSQVSEKGFLDRASDRLKRSLRSGPELPTAADVRNSRALRAPIVAALRRRDMAVLGPDGPYEKIGKMFGFLSPRTFRHNLAIEARVAVARTAAAIRAFQLREGRPPRSLEELVPSVLAEVPLDPFDEKPLIYEVEGDGWRVASRVWRDPLSEGKDGEAEYPPADVRFPRAIKK